MNTTSSIIVLVLVSFGSALAQQADSAAIQRRPGEPAVQDKKQTPGPNQQGELKGFVDKNANGIDDRLEISAKGKGPKGKDKFIDKDGDGICDERATGMGFRRGSAIEPAGEQAGALERKRKRGGG